METIGNNDVVTRKEFLKKGALGALGILFLMKNPISAEAAVARDNLSGGGGGLHIGTDAPANKAKLWIDTRNSGRGTARYWDGSTWSATASVWDE